LRLEPELHQALVEAAKTNRKSFNAEIEIRLARSLFDDVFSDHLARGVRD